MSLGGLVHVYWLKLATAHALTRPIDCGWTFRGRRLLGDNKTIRGLLVMPLAATGSFAAFGWSHEFLPRWLSEGMWIMPVGQYALLGGAAGLAFMLAELPNSFLKRQLDVEPGQMPGRGWARVVCPLLDRFDSVLGVLIVVSLLAPTPVVTWVWILILGPGVHALFSALLYRLGVKERAL